MTFADSDLSGSGLEASRRGAGAIEADLRRLGARLAGRVQHVVAEMASLADESGRVLDTGLQERVATAATCATRSIAGWMAAGDRRPLGEVHRECSQAFAQLAAHRETPLSEITEHCLLWRDAVAEAVHHISSELELHPRARARALVNLRRSLNAALITVCEAFEAARALEQEELSFAASHDSVTGLPGRALLSAEIERLLAATHGGASNLAVLLIDFDGFQDVNDSLGYAVGDALLRAAAQRLQSQLPDGAVLGRLGGDELVAVIETSSPAEGEQVAGQLLQLLGRPFTLQGHDLGPLTVTASIGVAIHRGQSPEELLRNADTAVHRAKLAGRAGAVLFQPDMQDEAHGRMRMQTQLRTALDGDQLRLVYQPIFSLGERLLPTAVETLLRWHSPTRGVVSPGEFIPVLEETGLIVSVGRWVLEQACEQCARWHRSGLRVNVGVNVSARQLDGHHLIDDVERALSLSGLPPTALVVEITETAAMRDIEHTARVLSAIKASGVRVAIDDFGTGYSSLSHLQRLSADTLKIDRSFVSKVAAGSAREQLLRTLAQLGDALQMNTLAEGIETLQELRMLQEMGCNSGQGFLLSRPLEASTAETFLRETIQSATLTVPALAAEAHLPLAAEIKPAAERTARRRPGDDPEP